MRFYRFKTFNSTYFFPGLTEKSRFIYSLYGNYGGKGAHLFWWMFTHSCVFRWMTKAKIDEIEGYGLLSQLLGEECVYGINMGTNGPDQKKSVLGYDVNTDEKFFAKLSTKERAKILSRNEIKVYQLLGGTGLVPELYDFKDEDEFVYMKCECINGQHVHGQIDNKEVMDMLLTLKQKHFADSLFQTSYPSDLITCFAHMDFCPWNMIDIDDRLHIIDWEMAAEMPLGFDLFTYILQTYFLTINELSGNEIISQNEEFIDQYFGSGRSDWQIYLNAFIDWKIRFFSNGANDILLNRFKEMASN